MPKAKKFINDPKLIPQELTAGYISANANLLHRVGTGNVMIVNDLAEGKVGILVGGGVGGEPWPIGYLGKGMAHCAALGNINAAPPPYMILEGIKALNRGKGVLLLYNNYGGDILSFDMAAELAEEEGIPTRTVRVWDCVGSEPPEKFSERGGMAGVVYVIKVAGGAASEIDNLEEVHRIASAARDNIRTVVVAAKSNSYLENGELVFNLPEDEINIGSGMQGAPGFCCCKMLSANATVDVVLDKLLAELQCNDGDEVAVLVNSMGSTSLAELFIVNNRIHQVLTNKSINIHHTDVGYYFPMGDMVGFSVSLLKLNDETKKCFDHTAYSFGYKR